MTTQQRATKGGEIGANGEFYKGGAFIATTDRTKSTPRAKKAKKGQIAPYVWELAPSADHRAIFGVYAGANAIYNHETGELSVFLQDTSDEVKAIIESYNTGERWCVFNKETGKMQAA